MSNTQYVFIEDSRIPSAANLQRSIDGLKLPSELRLDPTLDLRTDSGFSPCTINGAEDVGFELFVSPSAEILANLPSLKGFVGAREICIQMVWRGSYADCACAAAAGYALAKDFEAVVSYEGQSPDSVDAMREATLEALRYAEGELQGRATAR